MKLLRYLGIASESLPMSRCRDEGGGEGRGESGEQRGENLNRRKRRWGEQGEGGEYVNHGTHGRHGGRAEGAEGRGFEPLMDTNRHEWEPGDLNSAAKEEERRAESGKKKGFLNRS